MAIETLSNLIRTHGSTRGDHVAIDYAGSQLSYQELDQRSSQVANALQNQGVGKGFRIAVLAKNCSEFYELLFGAAKLGAVVVPVNWRSTADEITEIVRDSAARVLVVGPEFATLSSEIRPRVPELEALFTLGGQGDFRQWVSGFPTSDPGLTQSPDDAVVQFYTAGTTGTPKGVLLTYRNFFTTLHGLSTGWRMECGSRVLSAMPAFHIGGTGWALSALFAGCTVALLPEVDVGELLDELPRCTHAFLVPAVIQMLVNACGEAALDFTSLEVIVYGASPISPTLLERALAVFGRDFIQVYGLTETCGAVIELPAQAHDPTGQPELLSACGRPYPWVEMRLVDPASMESGDGMVEVAAGSVGEVWIRSPQVMGGYWRRPIETADAMVAGGWLRTGDAGYLDDAGYLYLHDRVKDMIVSGAENIYPVEIEHALAAHPDLTEIAVVGVPHERWGETVKAVVVPSAGVTVDPGEVIEYCRTRLARYKCPTSVDVVDLLPRNAAGKLLKREIRSRYWADASRRIS